MTAVLSNAGKDGYLSGACSPGNEICLAKPVTLLKGFPTEIGNLVCIGYIYLKTKNARPNPTRVNLTRCSAMSY
jgi:hypothetical protein